MPAPPSARRKLPPEMMKSVATKRVAVPTCVQAPDVRVNFPTETEPFPVTEPPAAVAMVAGVVIVPAAPAPTLSPPLIPVMGAPMTMLREALRVSCVLAVQVTGKPTVMSPAWMPSPTVEMTTLAEPSAVWRTPALMTELLPVGVNAGEPVLLEVEPPSM